MIVVVFSLACPVHLSKKQPSVHPSVEARFNLYPGYDEDRNSQSLAVRTGVQYTAM
jgi:hypothetical protein